MAAPLRPLHPGTLLSTVVVPALQAAGVSKARFAELLGMTRQNFDNILNARQPLSAAAAVRLGRLIGGDHPAGYRYWLRLQADFDAAVARERIGAELLELPDLSGVLASPAAEQDPPALAAAA